MDIAPCTAYVAVYDKAHSHVINNASSLITPPPLLRTLPPPTFPPAPSTNKQETMGPNDDNIVWAPGKNFKMF